MRIYISADIEGIAGVVQSPAHTAPGGFEYEQARDWMTQAVLSTCEVAREHGADEVVVSDSHGNGLSIRYERMPAYVRLVRAWPRPLAMMQGIEEGTFAGAMFVGYHAGATSLTGVLAHTISGDLFQEISINGQVLPEAGINAAIAGHFGVPILMVAGDDVGVAEAAALLGEDIATAPLKTSIGTLSASMLSPAAADRALRDAAAKGLSLIGKRPLFTVDTPAELRIRFRSRAVVDWLAFLDMVERIDAYTIAYRATDIVALSRFIQFLTRARAVLA